MANKSDVVWFRNRLTGWVDGVPKGSAAYKQMVTEMTAGDDPEPVWERTTAPKTVKAEKYVSGATPTFQVDRGGELRYGTRDRGHAKPAEDAKPPAGQDD